MPPQSASRRFVCIRPEFICGVAAGFLVAGYLVLVQNHFTTMSSSVLTVINPGIAQLELQNAQRKAADDIKIPPQSQPSGPLAPGEATEPNPPEILSEEFRRQEEAEAKAKANGSPPAPPPPVVAVAPHPPAPSVAPPPPAPVPALPPPPAQQQAATGAEEEAKWKVIVLGWKRHKSLARLLKSLQEADYPPDVKLDLDIKIDGGKGPDWQKSIDVANAAVWKFGRKRVIVNPKNEGLAAAWFKGWNPPSDDHRAIFLEDDIAVSKVWYRWVNLMFATYGHEPWLAGVSLQHQTLQTTTGNSVPIKNDFKPFGYKLLGSWGFSPHPKHWREFIKIDYKTHNPDVKGLVTSSWYKQLKKGSIWTQHFIWYANKHNLFTVYLNPGDKVSLATNYREAGEHYVAAQGADFQLVPSWNAAWDKPPAKLNLYGWDCKPVPEPAHT